VNSVLRFSDFIMAGRAFRHSAGGWFSAWGGLAGAPGNQPVEGVPFSLGGGQGHFRADRRQSAWGCAGI